MIKVDFIFLKFTCRVYSYSIYPIPWDGANMLLEGHKRLIEGISLS